MKPHFLHILLLFALLLQPFLTADAQRSYPNQMMEEEIGLPRFHLDAITFLSDDPTKTRVVVYVQIMYDNLQFVNAMPGYKASYEVDFNLLAGEDENAPRMANRLWRSSVTTFDYEETNSRVRFDV
ncbi:hypothetical protein GF324_13235, partial [bacterium]|nr:hypothetical protein [bacterium]